MILLGLLLLIAAGGLGYLSQVDRMSALALSVVELDTQAGVPVYLVAGGAGLALLAVGLWQRRARRPRLAPPAPPPPVRVFSPPPSSSAAGFNPPAPAAPDSNAWVSAVVQAAQNLPLETGAVLRLDSAAGVPFLLELEGLTPEGERRSLDIFAHFLASIPLPPRARVRFDRHGSGGVLPQPLVNGALRRAMPAGKFQAMNREEFVEVLFAQPDPRWQARPYLFLDRG